MFCFFLTGVHFLEFWRHITLRFVSNRRPSRGGAFIRGERIIDGAFIEKNHKKGSVYSKHYGIEACGIQYLISFQELYTYPTLVLCIRFETQFFINLNALAPAASSQRLWRGHSTKSCPKNFYVIKITIP